MIFRKTYVPPKHTLVLFQRTFLGPHRGAAQAPIFGPFARRNRTFYQLGT
jgi:hypothetical protein